MRDEPDGGREGRRGTGEVREGSAEEREEEGDGGRLENGIKGGQTLLNCKKDDRRRTKGEAALARA